MEQYFAILMRNADFNDDLISDNEMKYLTPGEVNELSARIISVGKTYKEVYDEFLSVKDSYPQNNTRADEAAEQSADIDLEICIARISVMKNWERIKL